MPGWVTLDELLNEMKETEEPDAEETARLQRVLDASVEFVERVHSGRFNFDGAPSSALPLPAEALKLGTLMLAKRWDTRRRSPDGLVSMGDLGVSRVAYTDPDIARLLRLGRHGVPRVG